jgi:hypothetical protein
MPLTRGQIVGHDNERLAFAFTMMSERETVQCQIGDAAMDELAETKGTPSTYRARVAFLERASALAGVWRQH